MGTRALSAVSSQLKNPERLKCWMSNQCYALHEGKGWEDDPTHLHDHLAWSGCDFPTKQLMAGWSRGL